MSEKKLYFGWEDLEQWVIQGLLSPEQLTRIRAHVASAGPVAEQDQAAPEQRKGLNLISLAYYFGGFMILFAYTIFMGLQWENLGLDGQVLVSGLSIVGLWAIGFFLRQKGYQTAGGLLIFAGTGIVPLFVFSLQRVIGIWPDDSRYNYEDFYQIVAKTWVILEVASMLVAIFMIWAVRFPLISLLIAFWGWYLSMDITRWMAHSPTWSWSEREQIVSVAIGAGMLALGILLQRRAKQDYSLWFYLFGHILILGHLSALTLSKEGLLGLIYFLVYLAFVVASVWLQRRVFLVFGAIGVYGYLSYLAFQVFDGTLGFVFALASVGLLMILTAVGYQKYARPWLERQFAQRQIPVVGG